MSKLSAILSRRIRADYRAVYASPAGRRVLDDLMRFGGLAASSVHPERPELTLFYEGQRRVALRIAKMLGAPPRELIENMTTTEIGND